MSYAAFLGIFLLVPILGLAFALRRSFRREHLRALTLVCVLAFIWTAPWDNYAAAKGLWSFAPNFVLGRPFWFGWLPLEEYLFYFCEAIFVCLTVIALKALRSRR